MRTRWEIQHDRDKNEINRRWANGKPASPVYPPAATEAERQARFVGELRARHAELCKDERERVRRADWMTAEEMERLKQRIAASQAARAAEITGAEERLQELRSAGQ
jgi:hypothetical protein